MRFGVPFSEYDTVFFGIGCERTEINGATAAAEQLLPLPRAVRRRRSSSLPLTIGWARDSRDSALVPTAGRYKRVNLDWAPLGDAQLPARSTCRASSTFPITQALHLRRQRARSATARAWAARRYPIFKNFYGGGLGSVRGFDQGSLGPGRRDRRLHRRQPALQHQRRALRAGARRRQRPHAAPVRSTSTPATSGARTRRSRSTACAPRPASACQLDLAGGPAEAQLRHADPQAAER